MTLAVKVALNPIQPYNRNKPMFLFAKPHTCTSVGRVQDLRTGGRQFHPGLRQYSFRGLMIIIAIGFIPLSLLSVSSTMVMWESSQWVGMRILQSIGKENSRKT